MILGKNLYIMNGLICFLTTICYKFLHIGCLSWSDVSFFSYYGLKQDIFSSVKMKLLFSETVKETTERWAWLCLNIIFFSFTALESHLCILLFLLSTIYFLFFFCCAWLPRRIDAAGIHARSPLCARWEKWSGIVSSYGNTWMITSNG